MISFIKACWQQDAARRILWLPVLFAIGIALYFSLKTEPSKWLTLSVIEALILAAVLFRRHIRILKVLGCFASVAAGFATVQIKAIWLDKTVAEPPAETFYFKGRIIGIDTNYQGRKRFIFDGIEDFDGNFYFGKYRITQRLKEDNAEIGQCVELIGQIKPLAKEVMVGGYQFDRKGYFEGLKGSGFAESRWFATECPDKSLNRDMSAFIGNLRRRIVKHIASVLPAEQAGIASAIIAGEKGAVTENLYEQYRNSGLAHFLSISGLHMSMLAGLMFFLVRFVLALVPAVALRFDTKKIAAVFALVISAAYLLISGQAVPAQRAFIMTFIVLLGILADRRAISVYTIALAAFIVLFFSPEVLISASFQMSFAAVLGLIAFYEKIACRIRSFLGGGNKVFKGVFLYVSGVIVSDFIASLMTLPFAVYHFNMVAVYTTLGNFLAGPVIGLVIMPFVLLSMLLMPFGLDVPFLKIVGLGIAVVNRITSWVSALPNAGCYVPSMPLWGLVLIVLGGLWLMLWQAKWRWFGVIGIAAGLLSVATVQTPDILIGAETKAVAVKNTDGKLEIAASRGGRFIKDVWKNKYRVAGTKAKIEDYPDLKIDKNIVIINGLKYNLEEAIGLSVWLKPDGSPRVRTIRDDIGRRPWNK